MTFVTQENVYDEPEPKLLLVDSHSLGMNVDYKCWPNWIETDLGNKDDFIWHRVCVDGRDRRRWVDYLQLDTGIMLRVTERKFRFYGGHPIVPRYRVPPKKEKEDG